MEQPDYETLNHKHIILKQRYDSMASNMLQMTGQMTEKDTRIKALETENTSLKTAHTMMNNMATEWMGKYNALKQRVAEKLGTDVV